MFRAWLNELFSVKATHHRRIQARRSNRVNLKVDSLEDRAVPAIITLTATTDATLSSGADYVYFPAAFTNGGGSQLPNLLSIADVPVIRDFDASEDFVDLRDTAISTPSAAFNTNVFDEGNTDLYGYDTLYTSYGYGTADNQPFTISGNTLGTGGSPTGVVVGYTDSGAISVVAIFVNMSGTLTSSNFLLPTSADSDGTVSAGAGTEAAALATTITSSGSAVNALDFTVTDGATSDGLSLGVSQVVVHTSGTGDFSKVTWLLSGPDANNVVGTYNSGSNTITFSGLNISVVDAANETYIIKGYFNTTTGLTEGQTYILSVDADTDFTLDPSGTQMASGQSAVTNGAGMAVSVVATELRFGTQPAGSVSGQTFSTQPVVRATDANGNIDTNFVGSVDLTLNSGAGALGGTVSVSAVAGVATFSNVSYTATADQEQFSLTASFSGLTGATSNSVTSDVVATQLIFSIQPAPTSIASGVATSFTTMPAVQAVDANSTLDTGYTTSVVLSVTDPNDGTVDGTVNDLSGAGDTDGSGTTVTLTPSSGMATFAGLTITYTNTASPETIALRATSGGLTAVNSASITSQINNTPVITDLDTDSVARAGFGQTVVLDSGGNATVADTEFDALNGGNGDYAGGILTIQRNGTAVTADVFGFDTTSALFTVSGSDLQSGGLTFATFTNTGGVLTVNFTSSGTAATTALVQDVLRHISYRNDLPAGNADVRFTLNDGYASDTADVTATSDLIYINDSGDVSDADRNTITLREAADIANAQAGQQTVYFAGPFGSSQTITLGSNVTLEDGLIIDTTATAGVTITGSDLLLDGTLNFAGVADDTIASVIADGSGTGTIIKTGGGTLTLSGNNSYTGSTTVQSGYLRGANDNAFGAAATSSTVSVESGASLELSGGITLPSTKTLNISGVPVSNASKIQSISGNNTIQGDIAITGGNNVAFDVGSGTTLTVSGAISGSLDFDKNNSGTLILSGTNTHTGNVNVGDGTLIVNGSLATSNAIFVDGRLGGSGTVPVVTISGIGTLAPGNSPGILSTGNLTFQNGSTYSVELDGTTAGTQYDQTDVIGSATLADATLSLSLGFGAAIGDSFIIINNDGSDATSGTFNGLAEGSTITIGAVTFSISYAGGTNGNDVVLTVTDVTYVWDGEGTDRDWTNGVNWVGDVGPTAGSNLVFAAGAITSESTNNFASGTNFNSITIAASGYDIYGNSIDLTNGITTTYTSGSSGFSLDIALAADKTFDSASGGTLDYSGALSGGFGLNKTGAGTLALSGTNSYTGATIVNAGSLSANSLGSTSGLTLDGGTLSALNSPLSVGVGLTIGTGGATLNLSNGSITIAGISGSAGLIVNSTVGGNSISTGTDNSSTFSGTTTVNNGILEFGNNAAYGTGTITINGGKIRGQGATARTIANDLVLGGTMTMSGSAAMTFTGDVDLLAGTRTVNDSIGSDLTFSGIISNGNLTVSNQGLGKVVLSGTNTYGTTSVTAGSVSVAGDSNLGSGLVTLNGGTLVVTAAATIDNAFTLGASGGAVNTTTSDVTLSGAISGSGTLTKQGTGALTLTGSNGYGGTLVQVGTLSVAGDGNLGTGAVALAATTTLEVTGAATIDNQITLSGDATFSHGAFDLTLSGPIGGAGGFTKTGTGKLTLTNGNNYSGATTISAGTFSVANNGNLPNASLLTMADGTTLEITSGSVLDNGITLNGAVTVTIDANGGLSGAISGSGSLTKTGTGTLALYDNNNTYAGTTTVSSGTLTIPTDEYLNANDLILADGTTLNFLGGTTFDNNIILTGNATVSHNAPVTLSGVVSGAFNLTKAGSGTMTISGTSNTYDGTIVSTGTLSVDGDSNLTNGSVTLDGGTLSVTGTGVTIDNAFVMGSSNGTVDNANALTLSGIIGGTGNLTKTNVGTLTLTGTNTYGATTISAGDLSVASDTNLGTASVTLAGGTTLTVTGATTIDNDVSLSGDATISNASAVTLSGVLSGSADLTKSGAGKLTLTNTGNEAGWSGDLIAQGNIEVASDDALNGGLITLSGGWLTITGTTNIDNAIVLATSTSVVSVDAGQTATLSGVISETGGARNLNKGGSGTLIYSGTNTYTGNTVLNGGVVSVGSDANVGSQIIINQGTPTLLVTGSLSKNVTLSNAGSISTAVDATLSGIVSGAAALTKTGAGALTLSGVNTHSGSLTVNEGSMIVSSNLATSSTTVASTATIGGSGSIANTVTVQSGGTMAPGTSPGILSMGTDLILAAGSTFAVEINGMLPGADYDQVEVTGSVDVTDAILSVSLGYTPLTGQIFTLIDNDGSDAVVGTFVGYEEGAIIEVDGVLFSISYVGGDGNDVTLMVVPSLSINDVVITEGNDGTRLATFTVTLSEASLEPITVNYSTSNGNAIDGVDYAALTGTLTFAAGETSKTISITIIGDTMVEDNETFNVVLSNPTGVIIADETGVATILNDDVAPPVMTPGSEVATPPASNSINLPTISGIGASAGNGPNVQLLNSDGTLGPIIQAYTPLFTGGVNIAIGDVDGDGVADVVTGANAGGGPHVKLFSGSNLAEMKSFMAYDMAFSGGVNVAVGDVDGDGVLDIITGAGVTGGPHVKVFSGKTGQEIHTFMAYDLEFTGGVTVASADFDGDGIADIITGTMSGVPHVKIFSGKDLSLLKSEFPFGIVFNGGVNVAAGDLDGDGKAEVILGAGPGGLSHVKVLQGGTLNERQSFFAFAPTTQSGVDVSVTELDSKPAIATAIRVPGGKQLRVLDGVTLEELDSAFVPGT
jgi:fibronectin-binding autotransporter adhesin